MDIASRPSTPVENHEMPDAAPPPAAPQVIRREDHRPPDWLVPEVSLAWVELLIAHAELMHQLWQAQSGGTA